MKKNLYSLTLSDDVVREVDALAHRMGTNRSALVNQILAEYVSVPTPERRWNDIFEAIEELMTPTRELVPFFAPNSQSTRQARFFLVESVTTSPSSSANFAACSASS